jgi:predicted lipoprotein with Yx(FWY)xxD motif
MQPLLTLVPVGLAVIAAGCGSSSPSKTASYAQSRTITRSMAKVGTRHTSLGSVLVDARGRTLYLFENDRGTASRCYGSCASVWPPLTTAAMPVAGRGALASKLGSGERTDGKRIVTYSGHPLYTYAGDGKAGDVHGQGADQFGAEWYALSPDGRKIDSDR